MRGQRTKQLRIKSGLGEECQIGSPCVNKTMCCSVIATRLFPSLFSGKREYNALFSSPLLSSLSPYRLLLVHPSHSPFRCVRRKRGKKSVAPFLHRSAPLWVTAAAATTISFESAHAPLLSPSRDRPTARPLAHRTGRAFFRRHLVAAARREGGHHVLTVVH